MTGRETAGPDVAGPEVAGPATRGGPSTGPAPALGAVIVSFNTRDLLDHCLTSLEAEIERLGWVERTAVWVVDNASADGSAAMVKERHASTQLVAQTANLGFAAANNVCLARWAADPDDCPNWILVLNPDTEVRPGALETLVAALEAAPDAAVAGPALVYPDGRPQPSAFRFPGWVQTWLDLFPVPRLMEHPLNGRYPAASYASGTPFEVDFPLGACLLVRGSALQRVGPLDDGFFMYVEEVDWCRRFREAGYRCLCVPGAIVVHHAGASSRQFKSRMFSQLWRSRLRYFRKHESHWKASLIAQLVRGGLAIWHWRDLWAVRQGRLPAEEAAARFEAYRAVWEVRS